MLTEHFITDTQHHQMPIKFTYPSSHILKNNKLKFDRISQNSRLSKVTNHKSEIEQAVNYGAPQNVYIVKKRNKNIRRLSENRLGKEEESVYSNNNNTFKELQPDDDLQWKGYITRDRIRRQVSSPNVFHRNSSNLNNAYFQSSASIKVLTSLDDNSGMFNPEFEDPSFFELVTEMSDKEFESLGFPVAPKPTETSLYGFAGNDHEYGLINSLGDHYETDHGGFSGIEIISRELLPCIGDIPFGYYINQISFEINSPV